MQPPKSINTHKNHTEKLHKQKQNLPQLTKPFFYLQRIPVKPTKQHSDQNPKGKKEARKEGRKEVRLNGIQPAKPKGGIAGEERSKTMKREKDQTGECVKWKTKTTKNTYNKSNKRIV
jgi:hypothetical protein